MSAIMIMTLSVLKVYILYFCITLKQNGIDPKPVPIYVDDEIVNCEVPDGMMYMNDDLAKIINIHPPEYELEECLTGIPNSFRQLLQAILYK